MQRGRRSPPLFGCLALAALAALMLSARGHGADWPQWLGPDGEGVWRATGLVDRFPAGGPKVIWRAPLGPGNSGPAVAGGRVYVMDRVPAPQADGKPAGNPGGSPGKERIVCLSAADGKLLWQHAYDCRYTIAYRSGPRTTPVVRQGRVWTLGAMGDLCCLDAATGAVCWARNVARDYRAEPPAWGWAASPLLDGRLLYCLVGGEGSAVVAFDKDTGKEVWKALTTEEIGYSPPILIEAGGKRQLIVWHSESVNGLDPATGKVYWTQPYPAEGEPQRPAPTIATVRRAGDLLFLTSFYHGPMMLRLAHDRPAASVLWKDKTKKPTRPIGLHCLMSTPVLKDGYIYGVCANGELRCCDMKTGDQLWETYAATGGKKTDCGTAFLVPQGERFVLFNDSGELILANLTPRAYAEIDRARIVEPAEFSRGRHVVWAHPAFAGRCVYARNNKEMVCVSLAGQAAGDQGKAPAGPDRKAAGNQGKAPAGLERKAADVVKQAAALHKNARALHVDAVFKTLLTRGKEKQQLEVSAAIDLQRPNRFALRTRLAGNPEAGLEVISDGKGLFTHARRLKQYTEGKAPADLAAVGKYLQRFGHTNVGMLFQNVLAEDPDEMLLDGVVSGSYAGVEKAEGTRAHHVRFKQADMDWELWVAAEGKPFVLKASSTIPTEDGMIRTVETYRNWRLDAAPGKDVFTFVPPPDAKKVKRLKPQPPQDN
jgi:outer membrane protein assembly factor BamB